MLRQYVDFILYKASSELAAETRKSYLGLIWWVVEPILYMATFYLIFGLGLRNRGADFVFFLLIALVPWKWISSSINNASGCLRANIGLIRQIYLPKTTLLLSSALVNFYKYLMVQTLLLLVLFWLREPNINWVWLPIAAMSAGLLSLGVSFFLGAIVPLATDFKILVENAMLLLFFLSGIFFDIRSLTPEMQSILQWNPVAVLLTAYRDILLRNSIPQTYDVLYPAIIGLTFGFIGLIVLKRLDKQYSRVMN